MKKDWTPEPWEFFQGDLCAGKPKNRYLICAGSEPCGTPVMRNEADWHRIVSCVNAMTGIEDPAEYRKQVLALVEAAKELIDLSDALIEVRKTSWGYDDIHGNIAKIKSTLLPFQERER